MKGIINVKCIALLVPDSFFRSELLVCQLNTLHTPHTHLPLHVACTLGHLKDHVRAVLFCLHAFWLVLLSCLPACIICCLLLACIICCLPALLISSLSRLTGFYIVLSHVWNAKAQAQHDELSQ